MNDHERLAGYELSWTTALLNLISEPRGAISSLADCACEEDFRDLENAEPRMCCLELKCQGVGERTKKASIPRLS